jgi:hypothetical protein
MSGNGTQTAALCLEELGTPPVMLNTEIWNGTSWTEVNDLNHARGLQEQVEQYCWFICWWRLWRRHYCRYRILEWY